MKEYNYINRIFFKKEIKENIKKIHDLCTIVEYDFLNELNSIKSLSELVNFHKKMWKMGFQHENIGPNKCGMFRCESIETMQPSDVYLGGINGLITENIPFWNHYQDEPYGYNGFGIREDYPLIEMILNQYKRHLRINLKYIQDLSRVQLKDFEALGYPMF